MRVRPARRTRWLLFSALAHRLALLETALAILLLQKALARHRCRHHAVIVFRMLEIRFVLHPVAARLGVACELRILLVNLRRGPTDLDVRPVALE